MRAPEQYLGYPADQPREFNEWTQDVELLRAAKFYFRTHAALGTMRVTPAVPGVSGNGILGAQGSRGAEV